jgi:hypothetical protein
MGAEIIRCAPYPNSEIMLGNAASWRSWKDALDHAAQGWDNLAKLRERELTAENPSYWFAGLQ